MTTDHRVPSGIRGLSDSRRIPRLGKIRLGAKATNAAGVEHPVNVDYFVVPPELAAELGEERPTELRIVFPSDDPNVFAPQNLKQYRSGGLVCRGDGNDAIAFVDLDLYEPYIDDRQPGTPAPDIWVSSKRDQVEERMEWRPLPCAGSGYDGAPPCPAYERGDCSETMHLMVILPDVPGLGVWQIDTGSYHSIVAVNSFVAMVQAATGGRVAGIPFVLSRAQREVNRGGRRRTVNVLEVRYEGSWSDLIARHGGAIAPPPARALIEVPADDAEPADRADVAVRAEVPAEPEATGGRDPRLGRFESVGQFLLECWNDLGLASTQVRERAGLDPSAVATALLDIDGGLDALATDLRERESTGSG